MLQQASASASAVARDHASLRDCYRRRIHLDARRLDPGEPAEHAQPLRTEEGVGFIYITHDLALAKYFAWEGRTAVMYLGKIVEVGPTPQVINSPQHPYTRALLEAVPEPDPELAAQKKAAGGLLSAEIPSLSDLPSGCTFHPRCPLAEDRCREIIPVLRTAPEASAQEVACMVVTDPQPAASAGTAPGGGGPP